MPQGLIWSGALHVRTTPRQRIAAAVFQSAPTHEPTGPSRSFQRTEYGAEADRPSRCAVSYERSARARKLAFRERREILETRLRLPNKLQLLRRGHRCRW